MSIYDIDMGGNNPRDAWQDAINSEKKICSECGDLIPYGQTGNDILGGDILCDDCYDDFLNEDKDEDDSREEA